MSLLFCIVFIHVAEFVIVDLELFQTDTQSSFPDCSGSSRKGRGEWRVKPLFELRLFKDKVQTVVTSLGP